MLLDYHIHLEHGPIRTDWLKQFADVASRNGIDEIGISEHIFRFYESAPMWPSWWRFPPDCSLGEYVDLIKGASHGDIPVKLGVEAEYLDGRENEIRDFLREAPWDYVIGSVHFIGEWCFDDLARESEWDDKDVNEAYRDYFALLDKAIGTGLFDIIGHPDVIKVFGRRASMDLRPLYEKVADTAAAMGVAVEVSTAGLRKPVSEMYPHPDLLGAFSRRNVPIVVSSDAHYPEHVGHEFARAVEYARAAGYCAVTRFDGRNPVQVPLG